MLRYLRSTVRSRYFCCLVILGTATIASAQIPVDDVGALPRHNVENEHVVDLLDHSNFTFVGRSNPHGPYPLSARNWTDLYGYIYDGTDPQYEGRRFAYASTGGFTRRGNFLRRHGGGVAIFDVTATGDPDYYGTLIPDSCGASLAACLVRDVEVHNGIGYFSSDRGQNDRGGVFVADLRADPINPPEIAHLNDMNFAGLNAVHEIGLDVVSPSEAYLYVNDSTVNGRVTVYDVSDARAGITKVADITGVSTHGVFAQDGVLYVSGNDTVTMFDVSDIRNGNFEQIGLFETPGGFTHSGWPDTYVNSMGETRNVFYLTHEASGTDLQVWDVTDVISGANPAGGVQIAAITNQDLAATQGTGDVTNSHNVFLVGDTLFASWTVGGMVVMDVADPENPRVIDTFDTTVVETNSNFAGAFGVNAAIGFDRVLITDRATGLWVVDVTSMIPQPYSACDFNNDTGCDVADINELMSVGPIASGVNVTPGVNDHLDLTEDGVIDLADRDAWLAAAATANGLASPFIVADANLDGLVDGEDFILWNESKFTSTLAWNEGDFNGDGVNDEQDFMLWNDNRFTSSVFVFVPEPSGALLLWLGILWGACYRRRN